MFKRNYFILIIALTLLIVSGIGYTVHYFIFNDIHHIFIYLVGDLAFLPLEVLLVVIIIERVLAHRDRQDKLQKLNMVVGGFFSEVGNHLLENLLEQFNNHEEISQHLNISEKWTKDDFRKASKYAYHLKIDVDCHHVDLDSLKIFLSNKRHFILALLGNPNLLEHDTFTDLLWAVTHLDEELEARPYFIGLPEKDLAHLGVDIQRCYDHLSSVWLSYVENVKSKYPYLFSLILRTHPFQKNRSPIVSK